MAHHTGDRVARQTENWDAGYIAEHQRLSWPHRNAPEIHIHAARQAHLERGHGHRQMRLVVTSISLPTMPSVMACRASRSSGAIPSRTGSPPIADTKGKSDRVRTDDLIRSNFLAWHDNFVARRKYGDPRRPMNHHPRDVHSRGKANMPGG